MAVGAGAYQTWKSERLNHDKIRYDIAWYDRVWLGTVMGAASARFQPQCLQDKHKGLIKVTAKCVKAHSVPSG